MRFLQGGHMFACFLWHVIFQDVSKWTPIYIINSEDSGQLASLLPPLPGQRHLWPSRCPVQMRSSAVITLLMLGALDVLLFLLLNYLLLFTQFSRTSSLSCSPALWLWTLNTLSLSVWFEKKLAPQKSGTLRRRGLVRIGVVLLGDRCHCGGGLCCLFCGKATPGRQTISC